MGVKEDLAKMADELCSNALSTPNHVALMSYVMEHCGQLRGYARALPDHAATQLHDNLFVEDMKIKARQQALDAKRQARREEVSGDNLLNVEGGPLDATTIHVEGTPPEGGFCMIAGNRYQFRGGKLYHSPIQTPPSA